MILNYINASRFNSTMIQTFCSKYSVISTDHAARAVPREKEADTRPRHVHRGDDDGRTAHHDPSADAPITGMYIMSPSEVVT